MRASIALINNIVKVSLNGTSYMSDTVLSVLIH